jgi:hypothetical protein
MPGSGSHPVQRRLLGQTEKAQSEETISDVPPPEETITVRKGGELRNE